MYFAENEKYWISFSQKAIFFAEVIYGMSLWSLNYDWHWIFQIGVFTTETIENVQDMVDIETCVKSSHHKLILRFSDFLLELPIVYE